MTTIDSTWYQKPAAVPARSSAGGIVVRMDADQLFIALVRETNIPQFVLPKGGVDVGEDVEHAARREIAEEAGLTRLTLIREFAIQERLSYDKQVWLITHYFLFTTNQAVGMPTDTAYHTAMWW